MTETPAGREAKGTKTVEFEFFDRTWTIPSRLRFSHMEQLRADPSNVGIVRIVLDGPQLEAFREIDPDSSEVDAFTDEVARLLGVGSGGN